MVWIGGYIYEKIYISTFCNIYVASGDMNNQAKELTVEEYYNFSPKDGTTKIIEDNLAINISNMSDSNYYDIGLEIKDEAIHVIARCDGP